MKNKLFSFFFSFFFASISLDGQKKVSIAINTSKVYMASLPHPFLFETSLAAYTMTDSMYTRRVWGIDSPKPVNRFNSNKFPFLLYYQEKEKCPEFSVNLGVNYDFSVFYQHFDRPDECLSSKAIIICPPKDSLQKLLICVDAKYPERTFIKIKEKNLYKGALFIDKHTKRACYIVLDVLKGGKIRIQEVFLLDTDWQIIPKKVCIVPEHVFLNYTPLPPNVIPDRHNMKGGSPMRCVYLPKFNNKPKKGRVHIIDYLRKNNLVVKEPFPWSEVFED